MLLITDIPAGSDTSITTPDTGDRVMKVLVPLIVVMVIAVAGIVYVAVSSKKKKEDK
jgi:flagellar basal body-associated protein FliL